MKRSNLVWIIVFIAVIAGYIFLHQYYNIGSFFEIESIINIVESTGIFGPIVYVLLMALAIIISPIPSLPLDAASGVIWGPIIGTILSLIGAEIGAIIAFLIARKLGREYVEKKFHRQIIICYNCNERYLFWLVLVSRLFPFFQFDIISYGAGLTNMKLRSFAIATFIGMIPMTYVFARFGHEFMVGNVFAAIATLLIIAGFFVVPVLIEKYNFLWLRGKIVLKKK